MLDASAPGALIYHMGYRILLTLIPLGLAGLWLLPEDARAQSAAGPLAFPAVFEAIRQGSAALDGAARDAEAAALEADRRARHWMPRLYAEARGYHTNDALGVFGAKLSERAATAEDLSVPAPALSLDAIQSPSATLRPDNLNHPSSYAHARGALGIDAPLYEGGAPEAHAEAARHLGLARDFERRFIETSEYAYTARAYGALAALARERERLVQLRTQTGRMLGAYQVGLRANPIGYAGWLGLRSLANRLDADLLRNAAETRGLQEYFRESAPALPPEWRPESLTAAEFAARYLKPDAAHGELPSYRVLAMRAAADSFEQLPAAERARFLPTAGLFAEANLHTGERATATSYYMGFYVRMSLFSAQDYGAVDQAELTAAAARARALDAERRERAERAGLVERIRALEAGLQLLESSASLLAEQSATALRLYQSGAGAATQLAEALNRRADLALQQRQTEQDYITARAMLILLSDYTRP